MVVALSVVAALVVLAVLTWQVVAHGAWWRADVRLDAAVLRAAAARPGWRGGAQVLADAGDLVVALPVLAAALGYAGLRRRAWFGPAVYAGLMAVTGLVVSAGKAAVGRPAPGTSVLGAHSGYFPSGHAATAAMASGLVVLALLPLCRRAAARRLLVAAAVPLNLAVGAALVWRGYHWPLDVAASWCLCWVLLVVGYRVTRWWGSRG
ncbi:phosphatase PAP2 family protein [Streptomyces sp. SL13]|uniref:Phosphatase PAP2 family protein n=1 Tax=Streptantibioticus silvisoli TaxID=2705255 RepID=A0AA90HA06_9ACTN|nr:phosphatase PAP2 family protein [Streptantibioticus silvisoli]MDI5972917.1 phosphatase PAP2 family protein [Streptantibioticus silvisoli]